MAEQIYATKGNLIKVRKTLALCQLGYELMDRKRNILIRELLAMIETARTVRGSIERTYNDAYSALQDANISLGVIQNIARGVPQENGLTISTRSVMGVELPKITLEKTPLFISYGFQGTNSRLDTAYICFEKAKEMTVVLAEIENSIFRLANAIKKTQMRANSLKNIMIPRYSSLVKEIADSLEEKEREEFSRLKVIKLQKQRKVNS